MRSMMQNNAAEWRRKVNNEIEKIRDEFLNQACRYLFGQGANCNGFRQMGLGLPALQATPLSDRGHQR